MDSGTVLHPPHFIILLILFEQQLVYEMCCINNTRQHPRTISPKWKSLKLMNQLIPVCSWDMLRSEINMMWIWNRQILIRVTGSRPPGVLIIPTLHELDHPESRKSTTN